MRTIDKLAQGKVERAGRVRTTPCWLPPDQGRVICTLLITVAVMTASAWATADRGKVVTYPAPAGETLSSAYRVEAGSAALWAA